ncbi:chemotaxis protein CheB [Novosphingobium sp.]|jgi:two-component system chemotaxis response regulator CheB|uniref:chemotaxis protein CheB n=1 Tax=Novosphingobium sp. TaxID=1874826 RepID=UPI001EBDB935|nr:chemotaxis protein CheB [Novosphingobium sp.]MBK6800648.1 response regulator [Novosphingobium sp.]MBK9011203.1 response regulator [Novosphingobium sp.]
MHEARVLVVDDSAAMRALFSDLLDQTRNVRVVGTAASAAEARDQIAALRPNVLTLDVEMPGMSGIEFLAEVMEEAPMPVVMLSSLTQSGTETSLKAYELGAVECFPKPLRATPEQFAKTVGKLGKIVLAAANSNVRDRRPVREPRGAQAQFTWNGHYAAFSASMGGIDALGAVLAEWPAQCPPTVIVLQTEPELAHTFIARLDSQLRCAVRAASDGAPMTPGHVYIASDPDRHVVFEAGSPARLRLVEREPVDGARPSATLLFGTMARAGLPAVGAVLTGMGEDGARGLKLMRDAGCDTLAQDPASATVAEAPAAALASGGAARAVPLDELDRAVLDCCNIA